MNEELNQYQRRKENLNKKLTTLRKKVMNLKQDVAHTEKQRRKEVREAE